MNKEQFIYWLKGFTKAANEEGPTLKQWETIVSELDKIKDCPDYSSPIGGGEWVTSTTNAAYFPIGSGKTHTTNQLELDLK
jgi:hypothetical protein